MKMKTLYNITVEVTEIDGDGVVRHDKQDLSVEDDKGVVRNFLGNQFNRFVEVEKDGEREW